jgi:hypothetical protein
MNKKRFVTSFTNAILFFALTHIGILFILAVVKQDLIYLNFFNIMDISRFFPGIDQGMVSFVVSGILMALVFSISYLLTKNKKIK